MTMDLRFLKTAAFIRLLNFTSCVPTHGVLSAPNITANLYCICSSEPGTCAYADAVQICSNI